MSLDNPAAKIRFFRKQSLWLMMGLMVVLGIALLRMGQAQAQRAEEAAHSTNRTFPQIASTQVEADDRSNESRVETTSRDLTYSAPLVDQNRKSQTQYQKVTQPRVVFETIEAEDGGYTTQQRVVYGEAYVPRRVVAGYAAFEDSSAARRIRELSDKIRALPEDQRPPDLMTEFKKLVAEQFEQRHQSQLERLDKILADAKATEAALKRREEQKDAIIQRRMLELLGERDPLNWDYQPGVLPSGLYTNPQAAPSVFQPALASATPLATFPADNDTRPHPPAASPAAPDLPGVPGLPPTLRRTPPTGFPGSQPSNSKFPFGVNNPTSQEAASNPFGGAPQKTWATPAGSAADAKNVIATGYRLKTLVPELLRTTELAEKLVVPKYALAEVKNSIDETRTIWEFQKRELKGQLEVARIALETAQRDLESLQRIPNKTNLTEKQTFEARKEMSIAEVEMRGLVELLDWMNTFEDSIRMESVEESQDEKGSANQQQGDYPRDDASSDVTTPSADRNSGAR